MNMNMLWEPKLHQIYCSTLTKIRIQVGKSKVGKGADLAQPKPDLDQSLDKLKNNNIILKSYAACHMPTKWPLLGQNGENSMHCRNPWSNGHKSLAVAFEKR